MISRAYSFLAAVMVAVAACGIAAVPAAAQDIDDTLGETMRSAFVYGFPVYEMMRLRWQTSENPDNSQRLVINRIGHVRGLIDHTRRVVTMPNNDTVYSLAWLDLSAGPVRVRVPDTDGRYYSLALLDIYTNNAASIGRRTIGSRAADFVVVAPEWREALPERLRVIRAPTNDALILARVLVDGPADLPTANTVQDGIRIEPLDPAARSARPGGIKPIPGDPENFLAIVNQALGLNPTPAYERVRVKSFEAVGLRPGETGAWQTLPGTVQTCGKKTAFR